MNKLSRVQRICVSAVCLALCVVLPQAFHATGLGSALSPMHIPVLLCGLVCGGHFGLICGIIGPILSSVVTGMPPANMLVSMVPELAAYGLVCGILMNRLHTNHLWADLYIALGTSMILGRVVGGIAKALLYLGTGEAYSLSLWVSAYFVSAVPAIVCHLILVPALYAVLERSRLIPSRY